MDRWMDRTRSNNDGICHLLFSNFTCLFGGTSAGQKMMLSLLVWYGRSVQQEYGSVMVTWHTLSTIELENVVTSQLSPLFVGHATMQCGTEAQKLLLLLV